MGRPAKAEAAERELGGAALRTADALEAGAREAAGPRGGKGGGGLAATLKGLGRQPLVLWFLLFLGVTIGFAVGFGGAVDLGAGRRAMCKAFGDRCEMCCLYEVTDRVYLDFTYGGDEAGRVEVGLFGKAAPKTVANFKGLVQGQAFGGYKDSKVHRLEPGYVMQMGDYELGNGYGGRSIYDTADNRFDDENLAIRFGGRGTISMANKGPDTNGSQFCIMLGETPQLNGKYQVFGFLLDGMGTVDFLEKKGKLGPAAKEIRISDCGFLPLTAPAPPAEPAASLAEPAPAAAAVPAAVAVPTPAPAKCMGGPCPAEVTDRVYLDIAINGRPLGRVELGLFGDVVPMTVGNFKSLMEACEFGGGYLGNIFHRVIPGFMMQGGDITATGNGRVPTFDDENFDIKFFGKGTLAMANSGPDTNGSQFFICFGDTPWLDGRHVVFGSVLSGYAVVAGVEKAYETPTGGDRRLTQSSPEDDTPILVVEISACGVLA